MGILRGCTRYTNELAGLNSQTGKIDLAVKTAEHNPEVYAVRMSIQLHIRKNNNEQTTETVRDITPRGEIIVLITFLYSEVTFTGLSGPGPYIVVGQKFVVLILLIVYLM